MRRHGTLLGLFLGAAIFLASVPAVLAGQDGGGGGVIRTHALSMHGDPLYPADFPHFSYANPDAPKGGALRLAYTGSFDNLNSNVILGNAATGLDHLNDRLMQRSWSEPFTLYGLVAHTVEISKDRSQITFFLRPEARFHDGQPMTASDVLFSYEALRDHGHPVRRRVYSLVQEAKVIDDHTIRFTFGPGYDRESALILAMLPVLPRHYWQDVDISKTTLSPPLGSGPYRIESVDPGRRIVYARVKDWWAKDLPVARGLYNFDSITYLYFRDDSVAMQSLLSGGYDLRREYDVANWMRHTLSRPVQEGKIVPSEIQHQRPEWLKAFIFNTRRDIFADRRVREALSLMFDADWVNQAYFHGRLKRIDSTFANSSLAATGIPTPAEEALLTPFKDILPLETFGPAWQPASGGDARVRKRKALDLLAQSGWRYAGGALRNEKGRSFSFEILLPEARDEKIALAFVRSLAQIGIEARVRTVDSAQFTRRLDGFDYDMVLFRWINSLSPGNEQTNYWGKQAASLNGSRNYAGVRNDAVDHLADAIARTESREDLVTHARALDRVLMQGYYFIPLFYLGEDLIFHVPQLKRPESSLYGAVLESWWREE